jgi:hypothetical protein
VLVEERALQAAMRASDVDELDRLLHDELLAVGPEGQLDKVGDLAAHRSGVFTIAELQEEEVRVNVVGDTAVTFVVLCVRRRSPTRRCRQDALPAPLDSEAVVCSRR